MLLYCFAEEWDSRIRVKRCGKYFSDMIITRLYKYSVEILF